MRVKHIEREVAVEEEGEDEPSCIYYISEGVFGAFKDSVLLQVSFIPKILVTSKDARAEPIPCKLLGPSIHADIDVVNKKSMLPPLAEGDWLYYTIMGAYTDSLKSVSADETVKIYGYDFGGDHSLLNDPLLSPTRERFFNFYFNAYIYL